MRFYLVQYYFLNAYAFFGVDVDEVDSFFIENANSLRPDSSGDEFLKFLGCTTKLEVVEIADRLRNGSAGFWDLLVWIFFVVVVVIVRWTAEQVRRWTTMQRRWSILYSTRNVSTLHTRLRLCCKTLA